MSTKFKKEIKMLLLSKRLFVHMKSLILSAIMAGFAAGVLVIVAEAQDLYPKWVCSYGYVLRDIFEDDPVCVTQSRYQQIDYDNRHARERIDENSLYGGIAGDYYGCLSPYVWRLAGPH